MQQLKERGTKSETKRRNEKNNLPHHDGHHRHQQTSNKAQSSKFDAQEKRKSLNGVVLRNNKLKGQKRHERVM